MTNGDPPSVNLRIDWSAADDMSAEYANQILAQATGSEIFLTFGQLIPPVWLGTPEEQAAQARDQETVAVKVLSRVLVTPEKVIELIEILGRAVDLHERQRSVRDDEAPSDESESDGDGDEH